MIIKTEAAFLIWSKITLMNPWKWMVDYFDLRRSERRGAAVLLTILLLLIIAQFFVHYAFPRKQTDFTEIQAIADEFAMDQLSGKNGSDEVGRNFYELEKPGEESLFQFDPNTLDQDGFMRLGLSRKIAGNIIKYRNKGGQFRSAGDFKKIYGITEKKFNELLPFIIIGPNGKVQPEYPKFTPENYDQGERKTEKVELNGADSSTLVTIKGIGPVFASRILKYRRLLGGFYQKSN